MTIIADLGGYLATMIVAGSPNVPQEKAAVYGQNIADVVFETPAVTPKEIKAHIDMGLLLVSIVHYESNWADWVLDGSCNDRSWRATHQALLKRTGDCDGGHAYSGYQIHPKPGRATGPELIADFKVATREAMFIVRLSLSRGLGLCGYTGEYRPNCPKAVQRLEGARAYAREHPFLTGAD